VRTLSRVRPLPRVHNRVTEIEAEGPSHIRELDRIAAFTDGVLAIAITLLVLSIDVPHVESLKGDVLSRKLLHLWPDLLAYALSFSVIGRYWIVHHRFFAKLERYDRRLVVLNLGFLAFVVLIPFTSDLLGDFGDTTAATVAYAVDLTAVALLYWLLVHHSLEQGFVRRADRQESERFGGNRGLLIPGIFVVSIPVAFGSPLAAKVLWLLIFLVRPRLRPT
jgi:uncharacterized membrane protein